MAKKTNKKMPELSFSLDFFRQECQMHFVTKNQPEK